MNNKAHWMITAAGTGGLNSNPDPIPGVSGLQVGIGYGCYIATAMCIIAVIGLGLFLVFSHESAHQGRTSQRVGYTMAGCMVVGSAGAIGGRFAGFNLFTATPKAVPGLTGLQQVVGGCAWAAVACCVLGIVLAGVNLFKAHNSGGKVEHLIVALVGCAVVGSASGLTGAFV